MAKAKNVAATVSLNYALLAAIVAAGAAGMFAPQAEAAPLAAAGFVETNAAAIDPQGNIATRATEAGIAESAKQAGSAPAATGAIAQAASTLASKYAIETGVAMPAGPARGRTATTYPFDLLEVGQSFFVPNDAEKPNAAKSLASTVTSANARHSVEIPGQTKTNKKGATVPATRPERLFVVRSVEGGARVWRVALPAA
jgi:hypothetical protein